MVSFLEQTQSHNFNILDCEDGLKPCQRKISVMVPDSYVNSGSKPKKYYDAGTIELAGKFKGKLLWTRNVRTFFRSNFLFKCEVRLVKNMLKLTSKMINFLQPSACLIYVMFYRICAQS